ncbi:MAG: bifunctional biotin--[acetyl-CoA-carboxylase] synthetase/biotin operon repressor, partial [Methylomonas sp.]
MAQQVHKPLISLISDGKFHSGTELAAGLGLSRSAVWKHLQGLTALGLDVKAVPGKGYRLGRPLHLLSKTEILANLAPPSASRLAVLDIHDTIASTNAHLMERGLQSAASGHICLAEYQSAGRGRRGRRWISPFGHNV